LIHWLIDLIADLVGFVCLGSLIRSMGPHDTTQAAIKRKMSSAKMALLLDRLEINGQPRWGLSSDERVLVQTAREKYNLS
jgi:hypothetical protein